MGHWEDESLPELKSRLGIRGDTQDERLRLALRRTQRQIELLSGRTFGRVEKLTMEFMPGGLPFMELPDLQVGSHEATTDVWPIADPVHPHVATVLQLVAPYRVWDTALPKTEALWAAGRVVALAAADEGLTVAVARWLSEQRQTAEWGDLLKGLLDPQVYVQVPVATAEVGDWWVQLSRRVRVITRETPDDQRLLEVLSKPGGPVALAACEPVLIVARLTEQPVRWAMRVRLWMLDSSADPGPWRLKSVVDTIHGYGLPIITIDEATTPEEAGAQLLLAAHWHGYLAGEEHAIPGALARAFPREVGWIRRGTDSPDDLAAATLLFERLHRRGFDPTRDAGTMRHYVRGHARTLVRAHRAALVADPRWSELGISERYYYRLLRKFAVKHRDGRYDVDGETLERLRRYVDDRARRRAALELLHSRGFERAAARKWLQRHALEEIRTAQPRRPRGGR